MAEEQKPVEVPKQEVAAPVAVAEPAVETKIEEPVPATTEPAVGAPAAEAEAATETPAAAVEDKKAEELKPVDEGSLEHKASTPFPKSLIYTKKFFWLGTEAPLDIKAIPSFKADKVAEVAHHVTAWASETGRGLLFYSDKSDKTAPHGAIQLAEASEPQVEGANKFHFTAKGQKHTFKASSVAERDSWVAQLKAKIAEAKELATTVTESETYKKTLESLKPAPAAKKEEKAAAPSAPAAEPATEESAPTVTEEEPAATEAAEESKKEEPKRRSASRKRASVFGGLFGKKEEAKAAEPAADAKATETEAPAAEAAEAAAPVEAPAAETTAEAPAAPEPTEAPAVEEATPEEKKEEVAKPKRQSIFGGLSFNKKKAAEPVAPAPVEETPAAEPVADAAPAIPPVETTEPLGTEVAAAAPAETTQAAPATNGETKKEMKSDKRKSSLPFGFGAKKEKAASDEEGEKVKSPSAFSKIRGTFKGKSKSDKAAEKAEDVPAIPDTAAAPAAEASTEAAPAVAEGAKPAEVETEATPAAPAVEEPAAKPIESTPAVTAAA